MITATADYVRSSVEELKRVSWPGKNKTLRLTLVVLGITIGVSAYLGFLDFAFFKLMSLAIKR